jgi:hypothetical protein
MDPLTIVPSVARSAHAVILNTYTIYQTAKAIKNAPKEAWALRSEILSVSAVLLLLEEKAMSPTFTLSTLLKDDLLDCKTLLDEMRSKMERVIAQKREQMRWPFDIKETQDKLLKMGRYKGTFNLALTMGIA